jgi:branched-chain amino acid transport system ATP-binding protein
MGSASSAGRAAQLSLRGLSVRYDTVRAIDGICLEAGPGEIVALIGANGAGKTTTLRTVCGLVRPTAGEVWYDGRRIDGAAPHRVAAMGVRMVPEGRRTFPLMSVRDNLLMGAFLRRDTRVRADLERVCARFPRLAERMSQTAGTLSGGEQQMVAIGRALMANPRLLLLDEPSLGLAPMMVREIARAIIAINREEGVAVVLVEQNSRMALQISHRAYVLETGTLAMQGSSKDLIHDDEVRRHYLGVTD